MVDWTDRKAQDRLQAGLRETRRHVPSADIDRRTEEGRAFDPRGYRRVAVYLTKQEVHVLDEICAEEGVPMSVAFRGLLRTIAKVK